MKGIENIHNGEATFKDVINELKKLTDEEKLYNEIHAALKDRMKSSFPAIEMQDIRIQIRTDITKELSEKKITDKIPPKLFEKVFMDMRKESVYLNQIFPLIIRNMDNKLREDFLENSGLDRFYVESLEKEFFEEKGLDILVLEFLREEKEV